MPVIELSELMLKTLHSTILQKYPDTLPGYLSESMVKGCMEYAMTYVYGYEPYPDIITKAAVLLHSIVTFHPFMDGNKRTALLATYFFLQFNGYSFTISENAVQLTKKIAEGRIKKPESVVKWLSGCTRRGLLGFLNTLVYKRIQERDLQVAMVTMLNGLFGTLLEPFENYRDKSQKCEQEPLEPKTTLDQKENG